MSAQWEQEKYCLVSWKFRDSLLLAKRRYAYTYGLLKLFASGMTVAVIKGGPLQIKALSAALKSPDSQLKWGHSALPRHLRRQVPGPHSSHLTSTPTSSEQIMACIIGSSDMSRCNAFCMARRRATSHNSYVHRRRPNIKLHAKRQKTAVSSGEEAECSTPDRVVCSPFRQLH